MEELLAHMMPILEVELIVTEGSYHDDIPDGEERVKNYEDFKHILNKIIENHHNKINFYEDNSANSYVKKLLDVWNQKAVQELVIKDKTKFLQNKRSKYSKTSVRRFLSFIKQVLYKAFKS